MSISDSSSEAQPASPQSNPATLRIEFMVPSARWNDFEATAGAMGDAATALGGALGVEIVSLGAVRDDRHVMAALLFADRGMLDRWRVSPEAAIWRAKLENLASDRPVIKLRSGVEVWLSSSVQRYADPPPKYKTALLGLVAVYPSLLLLNRLFAPLRRIMPFWIVAFLSACMTSVLLTWVLMPLLTRLFRAWLYPANAFERP